MIHTLAHIYSANVSCSTPSGRYVLAVAEPADMNSIRAAWEVLRGRAYAIRWPKPGELEATLAPKP